MDKPAIAIDLPGNPGYTSAWLDNIAAAKQPQIAMQGQLAATLLAGLRAIG